MRKQKTGKQKEKQGAFSGRDARSQAIEAAKIAAQKNKGKIKVRIDYRTEVLMTQEEYDNHLTTNES